MWLFTRYGFFSIAVKTKGKVEVRARVRQHLVELCKRFCLEQALIQTSPNNDYRFRMILGQHAWASAVQQLVLEQTWGNFKTEAQRFSRSAAYTQALHRVWFEMQKLQPQTAAERRKDDFLPSE